jgi:hypothetical protein
MFRNGEKYDASWEHGTSLVMVVTLTSIRNFTKVCGNSTDDQAKVNILVSRNALSEHGQMTCLKVT